VVALKERRAGGESFVEKITGRNVDRPLQFI